MQALVVHLIFKKMQKIEILGKIKTINFNEIVFSCLKSSSEDALNILFLGVTHGEEPQGDFLINKFIGKIKEIFKKC